MKTEQELRQEVVLTFKTKEELLAYIETLTTQEHDYGTCVYAMSLAATATFYYVAGTLGVSGFQAACADMDVIKRLRGYKGPFMIIDISNALYPQYDIKNSVAEFITECHPWLKEQAQELLDKNSTTASSVVVEHWKELDK